jgi:hypothetical protein
MPVKSRTATVSSLPAPGRPPSMEEMGVRMQLPFAGDGELPPWSIEGEGNVPVRDLIKMRKESGQARALMRLLTLPIRSAMRESEWIAPEGEAGEEEVNFMNLVFSLPPEGGGMSVTTQRIMSQILLAVVDGFAPFEKVWHVPDGGELAGKITLRKLAYRDPRTVSFLIDENGGFNGIRQIASVGSRAIDVKIPKEKCFYYAANEEENPFYGVSYFNAAWFHWDKVVKLYYLAHLAAQQAATGLRQGEEPANATPPQITAFRKALREFGLKGAMSVPPGFKVNVHRGQQTFPFVDYINHHHIQMSRSVLASFLDAAERQVLIDNSSHGADDMFVLAVEAMMDEVASAITHFIAPQLIDWNFGSGIYPVFRFAKIADSTRSELKDIFSSLAVASTVNATPEFLLETEMAMAARLGLDIDYESVTERLEEERKQDALQKQVMNQAAQDAALNPEPNQGPEEVAASETTGATLDLDLVARLVRDGERTGGSGAGPTG